MHLRKLYSFFLLVTLSFLSHSQEVVLDYERAMIRIFYKSGNSAVIQTEKDDPEIQNFTNAIDNYISTGTHCFDENYPPVCEFRFQNDGVPGNAQKQTSYNLINFDQIDFIQISKLYNAEPNCEETDYNCVVYTDKIKDGIRFISAWNDEINDQNFGFTKLLGAWKSHLKGEPIQSKKWEFRTKCSKRTTTLYVFDFNQIRHLKAVNIIMTQP